MLEKNIKQSGIKKLAKKLPLTISLDCFQARASRSFFSYSHIMRLIDGMRAVATIAGAMVGLVERWFGLTRISKLLAGRAIAGNGETYFLNSANVEKHRLASTSGVSAVRLQGMVLQNEPASDEESSSQGIDEEELAELLRLAEEYKTECTARRAALDAREAAPPTSVQEEAALMRLASEFNKDRMPGILQIARHGVALPAEMEVTADPASFMQIQKHDFTGLSQIDIQTDMMGVPETGGTVWPAGGALAAWFAQQHSGGSASDCCCPFDLRSIRSVIELGAGTGETHSEHVVEHAACRSAASDDDTCAFSVPIDSYLCRAQASSPSLLPNLA